MFFFLSKTVSFLVMPFTLITVFLLTSALVRSKLWRKRLMWTGLGLLLLFSNEFIANEAMKAWEIDATPYSAMKEYRLGIVLTGAAIPQREPNDRVYFGRGADRVIHTVQLYKLGLIEKILVSGGSGRIVEVEEPEADQFKAVMILMGVPDSVIVLENQTRNTHESAAAVSKMLPTMGYTPDECLLITSAFHMRRSIGCYRKANIGMDTFSTDFYSHQGPYYPDAFFIPKLDALVTFQKLFKEWIGITAYWIAGYV